MQRRTLITVGGAALAPALAGCTDMGLPGSGENETYSQDDEESLLFDEAKSEWPDDLERDDSINENFDRAFVNGDDTIVILMNAEIAEDTSTAEESMEKSRANYANDEDYPLADDGFVADDDQAAVCIFRHRNAKGQTLTIQSSGGGTRPDRTRATEYADRLFEHWPSE